MYVVFRVSTVPYVFLSTKPVFTLFSPFSIAKKELKLCLRFLLPNDGYSRKAKL